LDRPRAKTQLLGHGVIVDRRVFTVLLLRQYLAWLAQWTCDREWRVKTHPDPPARIIMRARRQVHGSSRALPAVKDRNRSQVQPPRPQPRPPRPPPRWEFTDG